MSADGAMLFYRQAGNRLPPPADDAGTLRLLTWQPDRDGWPGGIFATRTNQAWWLLHRAGAFARRDLTALAFVDGEGAVLHRLLVTPRWYRFPDMAADDLQMGDLWTAPAARGQGLARRMIGEVHRLFAGRCGAMWYLVDADNAPSRALIERIGYPLAGQGVRTRPLGLGPLGRYRLVAAL